MAALMDPALIALNAICPYFTMFPLDFPLGILRRYARPGDTVLDPFCGRGTTNFAARLEGLKSLGVDASPVATAISAAKLANTKASAVIATASRILEEGSVRELPEGAFWDLAYHPQVLEDLCRLRTELKRDCRSNERLALRGLVLGALHGPVPKGEPSYFSNQCPRTYAPKPDYAVRYWNRWRMRPRKVDVLSIIATRAMRYYTALPKSRSRARNADSRLSSFVGRQSKNFRFDWVITSPPYYGMRTYIPDQWLRNWFVGGPDEVIYRNPRQLGHSDPDEFAEDLRKVWMNTAQYCNPNARLVIRFGGISDRRADPMFIIRHSLADSGWRMTTARSAGTARLGKRQADSFLREQTVPIVENDIWCRLE